MSERHFVSRLQEHFSLSKETKYKCDSPIVSHPKNLSANVMLGSSENFHIVFR